MMSTPDSDAISAISGRSSFGAYDETRLRDNARSLNTLLRGILDNCRYWKIPPRHFRTASMSINSIFFFLFRLLARWRQPRLAAWLLYLGTRSLAHGGPKRSYRALVMTRTGFFQDIEETFRKDQNYDIVVWPSYALKAFASAILSPSLDHNFYLTDDREIEATKRAYRDFLAQTWTHFSKLMKIDVVLTGNFSYCAEREFAAMLETAGIPFIAIHKENVRPPKRVEYWRFLYKERRGPFTGRKILVYNDIERELQISSGIAAPDKIVVTGAPRLDRLHRWRHENASATVDSTTPQVLFFAFARHEKLTAIQRKPSAGIAGNMEQMDGDWGKLGWEELGQGAHQAMIELARRRPDIKVVVKTKGQNRKKDDILLMLRSTQEPLPPNLEVVPGGDPFELMMKSRVVIGFNTTGLLEALAAGKPVIVPWFGEAQRPAMREHIIDLWDSVTYAQSRDELIETVTHLVDNPVQPPDELNAPSEKALDYWVKNRDGGAAKRVLTEISNEVLRQSASQSE